MAWLMSGELMGQLSTGSRDMRVVTEVAERELRLVVYMHPRAIAIGPRFGRVQDDVLLQVELGGAAQRLAQDLGFVA